MGLKPGPKKGQRHKGQWKPGQSGNPKGFTRNQRLIQQDIAEKLEKAYTAEGRDILVDAIVEGTKKLIPPIMSLGAHYRWGKPKERVQVEVDDMEQKEFVGALESVLTHLKKTMEEDEEIGDDE